VPDFTKLTGDELIAKLGGDSLAQSHLAWQAIGDRGMKELWMKLCDITKGRAQPAARRIAAAWATEAVLGGRVHLNGARVKPAKEVRAGDTLVVTIGEVRREVVVRAVARSRGPAAVAATLYEETPGSVAARNERAAERRLARPFGDPPAGRPTKRDRRRLEALRRAARRGRP